MAYTGLQPITQTLSTSQQFFSGTGSLNSFTLQQAVGQSSDIIVSVGGTLQVPTVNYTASGTSLTFITTPGAGTNNISVQFLAGALNTIFLTANTFVLGTNVAPSISGVGATTTGIYWPSTSSLGVTVSGTNTVLFASGTTASSTTTGALQVKGGVGITGAAYVGGVLNLVGGQNSTGISSGALVVSGGIGASGSMYLGGSMTISGGLTVAGSFNTTSTNSLVVNTPFLFLANTNVGNAVDIGMIGTYENADSVPRYEGLYRTAADGRFRLFTNLTVAPTTLVTSTDPSYVYADLWLGNANVGASTSSTSTATGALIVPNGGVGIGGAVYIGGGIGVPGTGLGASGQFLSSTGSGLAWTTLSAYEISNGASNVLVSGSYVNISVQGSNVVSVSSTALLPVGASGNTTVNLGATTNWWGTIYGVAINAHYADLAENYTADADYAPGTVVAFGGAEEVTVSSVDMDTRVAGVVSTNPATLMNARLESEHIVALALTGRVPTQVTGSVNKGDLMVSAGNGFARAEANPKVGTVIGKALEDFIGGQGVIEVVVGKH